MIEELGIILDLTVEPGGLIWLQRRTFSRQLQVILKLKHITCIGELYQKIKLLIMAADSRLLRSTSELIR